VLVASETTDLLLQDALKESLFFLCAEGIAGHEVADGRVGRQRINVRMVHRFPQVLILQVPLGIHTAFIRLDVGEEALVIENAANGAVETMHSRVVTR